MLRKLKEKAGNEILQTLVIIAVIGALAITVCVLISNKIRKQSSDTVSNMGSGLNNAVTEYGPGSATSNALIQNAGK
jgi:preprotein translocase subunit SecG